MSPLFALVFCFAALLVESSGAYEHLFKDVYHGSKSESDLRRHLFRDYDALVRPAKDANKQINASIALTPINVRALDDKRQVIALEAWVAMNWTDDYLTWDPSHFGNINALRVPSTEVWRPDFAIYGSPDPSALFPTPNTNVIVYSNGAVLWVPLITIYSRCPILKPSKKIVTCNIKIGSWTFSENLLDIQLKTEKVDLSNFMDMNPNWKLMDVVQDRVSKYYPCCPEAYPNVDFNITLKRRLSQSENSVLDEDSSKADNGVNLTDLADIANLLYL